MEEIIGMLREAAVSLAQGEKTGVMKHGPPEHIGSDSGAEFTAQVVRDWLGRLGVKTLSIMAGTEDRVVDHESHSVWLHHQIPLSDLQLVPRVGHMVHYAVPGQVSEAIERVCAPREDLQNAQ